MLRTEQECIEYIHSAGRFGKKTGLCNIKALLDILGNPQRDLKCIHIAGTNGKGSVSCMIRSILTEAGYRVGMNTSPYIEVFNERLTIDGVNIPPHKLVYYTNLVADAIGRLEDIHPIEFEIITAMGFLYFKDENCDYAVIECGIGGLYDSTNVIESPAVNVITSIGFDHTDILGNTIEEIAYQKAGIIKDGSNVFVHSAVGEAALGVIIKAAGDKNATVYITGDDAELVSSGLDGSVIRIGDKEYSIGLTGSYQTGNAHLAIKCAEFLGAGESAIQRGLARARWKCRFEKVSSNVVIDGAHNYQGICAFADSVDSLIPERDRVIVVGMLNDKDFCASLRRLSYLKAFFVLTDVPSARQTNGDEVYRKLLEFVPDAVYEKDCRKALDLALKKAGSTGYVCVAGSLYLGGALRSYIKDKK